MTMWHNFVSRMEARRQDINYSAGKYYVLGQNPDGSFSAQPVQDWMYVEPCVKYKTLTAEEADEEYER
jgi:hypothetical protein